MSPQPKGEAHICFGADPITIDYNYPNSVRNTGTIKFGSLRQGMQIWNFEGKTKIKQEKSLGCVLAK